MHLAAQAAAAQRCHSAASLAWSKSTILSVDAHGFKFEYALNSAKHIPFDRDRVLPSAPHRRPGQNEIVIFAEAKQ